METLSPELTTNPVLDPVNQTPDQNLAPNDALMLSDIYGLTPTEDIAPTYAPTKFEQQYRIVGNGGSSAAYIYDPTNHRWIGPLLGTSGSSSTSTCKTLIPYPNFQTVITNLTSQQNNDTVVEVGQIIIPVQITVNQISTYINAVGTAGGLRMGIYSEDGQTLLTQQNISVSVTGINTWTLSSPLILTPGIYWIASVPVTGTDVTVVVYQSNNSQNSRSLVNAISGKAFPDGHITTTGGLFPSSFNPSTDVVGAFGTIITRFDN